MEFRTEDPKFPTLEFIENSKEIYWSFLLLYMMYLKVVFKVKMRKNSNYLSVQDFFLFVLSPLSTNLLSPPFILIVAFVPSEEQGRQSRSPFQPQVHIYTQQPLYSAPAHLP